MNDLHFLDPNPEGKKAVLLLHGLGANGSSWMLQFAPLIEAGFRPLAPDIPGFGQSTYDGRGWNIRRIAADLAGLLGDCEIDSAHVIGISMGGCIAQQFALDFPQRVDRLILVNTFAVLRPTSLSGWAYFLQRFFLVQTLGLPAQAKFVAHRIFPATDQEFLRQTLIEQVTQADPRAYRAAMRSLGLFNTTRRIGRINAPTLIISGANDTTVPLANQQFLFNHISGARQMIIPAAGHAVSVDQPDAFNTIMLKFLLQNG
jgi:3-oxoadipate enol-lactonase